MCDRQQQMHLIKYNRQWENSALREQAESLLSQVVQVSHWKPVVQIMLFKVKKERATSSGKLLSGDDDGPISLTH